MRIVAKVEKKGKKNDCKGKDQETSNIKEQMDFLHEPGLVGKGGCKSGVKIITK